jgi:hypothetical protein
MPKYRISANGEWFYTDVIEATDAIDARSKMAERIRNGILKPIQGPGISFLEHHRIVDEPTGPTPG